MSDQRKVLTIVVQATTALDPESEIYRYIMRASLLWENSYSIEVVDQQLDVHRLRELVQSLDSKYVIFMDSSHIIRPDYLEKMLEYLNQNSVFLAEPKIYTGALPQTDIIKENDLDYYYSRDTDIFGIAFNTSRLSHILDVFRDIDIHSLYIAYRLYWGIEKITPLEAGYSVSSVTKVANGLKINRGIKRILPVASTGSLEMRLYILRLVILFLRGVRQKNSTDISIIHLKEIINFYRLDEIYKYSEALHSFETGFLIWLADSVQDQYLYKQLSDSDIYLEFNRKNPGEDNFLLYSLDFAGSEVEVYKSYLPKEQRASFNNPKSYDFYSSPITPDSTIIFFDRPMQADDNAEHLYAYFIKNYPNYHNAYFALNPKSKDWERLLSLGFNLIPIFNEEFYEKFLISDLVVSSQIYSLNYRGKSLANSRFVYLQHGVQLNDMTDWVLSKFFDVFVSTGKVEYDYLSALAPKETINSGLPRFETLAKKVGETKHLLFMPTWRFNLQNSSTEQFMESDYFKSINNIFTDENLLEFLEENDKELIVQLHPNTAKRSGCFNFSDRVKLSDLSYSDAISAAEFIFTDYSSAVIDGTFVGIPIAYYQWDAEEFFNDQPYDARLSYEDDAMGPLFTQHQQIINHIISGKYKEIDQKYEQRRAVFFEGVELSKINSRIVERMLSL
ncbi:CDP-glycerol glycerophosphotransferase family protein [Rothia sp. P4278]|uniref:CDP-glycerol glycerophosphotransferase family protein n=1 Tax=Rothia sp. P4278 TaxID=3402658 RepID=UPI003AE16AD2